MARVSSKGGGDRGGPRGEMMNDSSAFSIRPPHEHSFELRFFLYRHKVICHTAHGRAPRMRRRRRSSRGGGGGALEASLI